MDPTLDLSHPELLRYLSGEISFETWLDNQQGNSASSHRDESQSIALNLPVNTLDTPYDSMESTAAIFSSWGSAFTGSCSTGTSVTDNQSKNSGSNNKDIDTEDDNVVDDEDEDERDIFQPKLTDDVFIVDKPSFQQLPPLAEDAQGIQGRQLIPFIESLVDIIPTCKVRDLGKQKQGLAENDDAPDIMKDFQNFQFRKRRRKGQSIVRNKLPELLRLQMGQANLLVAKGDFKKAADICMEIVREAPYSGLAFKTLAFIYEEQDNKEMSLQYSLISAFLDCRDSQEWQELSKKCLEAGNMKQALVCFERACRYAPGNISLHWERAKMYLEVQEYKKCLDIYQQIVKLLHPSEPAPYMQLAKEMAQFYHKNGMTEKAGETLEAAFATCPHYPDVEGVNMLSEILIGAKKYQEVIKLICSHCDVVIPSSLQDFTHKEVKKREEDSINNLNAFVKKTTSTGFEELTLNIASQLAESAISSTNPLLSSDGTYANTSKAYTTLQPMKHANLNPVNDKTYTNTFTIPSDLPLDIRIKLALCLIHTGQTLSIETVIEPLLKEDMNNVGDLVLDIAESFFENGRFQESLDYLLRLVESEKYNQAAVWLKVAECYENLGEVHNSIEAYYQVISLAPLHASVRLTLANALRSVGRNEDAINVLADYDEACVDDDGDEKIAINEENRLKLEQYEEWYKKCLVMYQEGRFRDFIYHSYILMCNYLMSGYNLQKKQTVGKAHMWELLLKILNVSVKLKENKKAMNLLDQALQYKPYTESKKYRLELDYLQTTLYFVSGEYSKAFDSFRVLISHEREAQINGTDVWNLFTQIANKMLDKRHHRYTLRFLFKKPKLIPLILHNGNNSHMSGTYKYAIGEFSRAFREWPKYPLSSLLLAISFLHLSCQKFHKTRHTSILHGVIFLFQYFNLREGNQEAYYNVGRAFHQIGLVHVAVYYYQKALEFPLHAESTDASNATYHPFIDLHREAAYNLSLIYKNSGNIDLARKTLYKYCWI